MPFKTPVTSAVVDARYPVNDPNRTNSARGSTMDEVRRPTCSIRYLAEVSPDHKALSCSIRICKSLRFVFSYSMYDLLTFPRSSNATNYARYMPLT